MQVLDVWLLFQIEGDTVTLSFEMRSGREHNTPDKAMWGFLITVRAQVRACSTLMLLVANLANTK